MIKYIYIIVLSFCSVIGFANKNNSKLKIKPSKIDSLYIQNIEEFELQVERICKPELYTNYQIVMVKKRDLNSNKIINTEGKNLKSKSSEIGSSCRQKWKNKLNGEKIEVDIIICATENQLYETIDAFTTKLYSNHFTQTDTRYVGDSQWVATNASTQKGHDNLMFAYDNTFVRIYFKSDIKKPDEIKSFSMQIAKRIEKSINKLK